MGDHEHGPPVASRAGRGRVRHAIAHFLTDEHDHGSPVGVLAAGEEGIRATKVSLVGLGVTAAVQAAIVTVTGSVALLSDTLHNLADALTAVPLWMAFSIGRRPANRRYTFGYHRFEDLAGVVIVAAIAVSAVLVVWESWRRLAEPRLVDHIPVVIAAGLVGALGNELVARYRVRVGRRIASEALVADGQHARADALTSLAVVAAGVGAAFGAAWVDPVAGLAVGLVILVVLIRTARRIGRRLLDGIEPDIVDLCDRTMREVPGVVDVTLLQARWRGHRLHVVGAIAVDGSMTVDAAHDIAVEVEHALNHASSFAVDAVIHVDPADDVDAHASLRHHASPQETPSASDSENTPS